MRRDGAVPLVDAALAVLDVRVAQHLVHRVAERHVFALERARPSATSIAYVAVERAVVVVLLLLWRGP